MTLAADCESYWWQILNYPLLWQSCVPFTLAVNRYSRRQAVILAVDCESHRRQITSLYLCSELYCTFVVECMSHQQQFQDCICLIIGAIDARVIDDQIVRHILSCKLWPMTWQYSRKMSLTFEANPPVPFLENETESAKLQVNAP